MPNPKGLQWNKNQLKIAYELLVNKKSVQEVADDTGFSILTVYKVQKAMNEGQQPPTLDPQEISQAPEPMKFGKYQEEMGTSDSNTDDSEKLPAQTTIKQGKVGPVTGSVSHSSLIEFVAQKHQLPMTPPIYIGYMCAVKKGFKGELVDYLSITSEDFWVGRGVNMYSEMSDFSLLQEEAPVGNQN